jgi:hypothetical protein
MENVRRYMEMKLVTTTKKLNKLIATPWYEDSRVFNEDLIAVKLQQKIVELNKPIYTGFTVLDLSKLLMYKFHYEYIVEKYGNKANLLFTDTDSLAYIVETENIYDDMLVNIDRFDTSGYPKSHRLYNETNKKV